MTTTTTTTVSQVAGRVLVLVCALVMMVAITVGSARASKGVVGVFGSSGSGAGQFANAAGTAVNTSTGDVYVVDQFDNRVERFDKAGVFISMFGWGVTDGNPEAEVCTASCLVGLEGSGAGQFSAAPGIAIDQATQQLYVVDANNNRVERFDAEGHFLSAFGWGVADGKEELQSCTTTCLAGLAGSGAGQLSGPQGIAVDPTDQSVYVADTNNFRVVKFDKTGAFSNTFGFGVTDGVETFELCSSSCQAGRPGGGEGQLSTPSGVAVDSTGRVYVLDFGNRIERYTSAEAFDQTFDPTDVFVPIQIATGPGNDDLYVAQWTPEFNEQHVVEIDSAGSLVDTHGVGAGATEASGLALNAANQRIYFANGFSAHVFVMDDVTAPTVTIDAPTGVTTTEASVAGTVNPQGNTGIGWHFEIAPEGGGFSPIAGDQDPGSGTSPVPVSQAITGLVPNTTYSVRLAATRAFNPSTYSSVVQFTTPAVLPTVVTRPANDLAPEHATFYGTIVPNHAETTYFFEYGMTTAYGARVPATDLSAGAGTRLVGAIQRVQGLAPGTNYHFRIVAINAAGTVHGEDQTFTTLTPPPASEARAGIPGAGFLPDERGWELVSPAEKDGNDIVADTGRTRASVDGNAAAFESLGAFADAHGAGVAVEYMSIRDGRPGTGGWSTHAITPVQGPTAAHWGGSGFDPEYEGEMSPDLSSGVFRTSSPVTADPMVENVGNLYERGDLRSPGAGSYNLVTACPVCESPLTALFTGAVSNQLPRIGGASADFQHVLFESPQRLTSDATATGTPFSPINLYEWDHGTVRLAGILPNGTAAPESVAGPGAVGRVYMPRTISADGSRVFFTVPAGFLEQAGALYERIDHATTIQLNASERTDCADHDPCSGTPEPDPSGSAPGRFWGASADGSRAFFTSPEMLSDDAQPAHVHLYMYDAAAPAGHHLSSLISDTDLRGVIGSSDDGHYVYALADGQPVTGQPEFGGPGIFLWHDGLVSYVGEMADPGKDSPVDLPLNWGYPTRYGARVTPDGRHLLFTSGTSDGLAGYDHGHCAGGGCEELYLYSATAQSLRCVSCNPTGAPGTSDAVDNIRERTSGSNTTWHLNHPVSDDGREVFFTTAEALVPGDTNGKDDVYEYDVPSGTVHLISSGHDPSDSYFMEASASGNDVFFLTHQQLVGWDHDQNYDLYDARVGGGMPEPSEAPQACGGDACRGPLAQVPGAATPGSAAFTGVGNLSAPAAPLPLKHLSNAQLLHSALKACKKNKKKAKRRKCEARARQRYGKKAAKARRSK
jgi:DNA-binding beta-propeller fold protein YncE